MLLVLALWLLLPFLHRDTPAQDAITFVVAADLAGDRPNDVYLHEGADLYDLNPAFRERSCAFYADAEDCDANAVAFVSSPAVLPLLAPLAWLDGDTAVLIVRLAGAAAMAAGFLVLLARLAPVDERLGVAAALLLTFDVNHQVSLGQTSPLLFLAAVLSLERARSRQAVALLAVVATACIAFKGFPAVLLVPVALARRWSVLAAVASMGAGLVALSLAVGGLDLWRDFFDSAQAVESASADNQYNASLTGLAGDPAGLVLGGALLVGLLLALRPATTDERWSLAMPLALLVVPQVWGHYLASALAAIAVVLIQRVPAPARSTLLAIALLAPYAIAAGLDDGLMAYQLAYLLAALGTCAVLVHRPVVTPEAAPRDRRG